MFRRFLLNSLTAALLVSPTVLQAKDRTSVETFMMYVKQSNSLVTVSDLWSADNNFDQTELHKNVTSAQPLKIDYAKVASFMKAKTFAINLVVPGPDGTTYTLELAQHKLLANDFEVHSRGIDGVDIRVDYAPGLYYRGVVSGIEGSLAAFSFFNNEIYGVFSIPEVGNFVLVPNTMVGEGYNYNPNYLVYNDADLLIENKFMCDADAIAGNQPKRRANKMTTTPNNKVYNNCKAMNWMHVADFGMYQRKGNSVTNCTNYITALVNANAAIYMNEGVPILSKYIQVNSASDEYASLPTTSSSTWLYKFGQVLSAGSPGSMHGCDLAMLLTTKGGGMGGVAWLDVICQGFGGGPQYPGPYGFTNIDNVASSSVTAFPIYSWDVSASTHEMGHNLGSQHTHACAWGPTRTTAIDRCYTAEGSCPNPGKPTCAVKGTIMSYCHLANYTATTPTCNVIGINFTNGFGQQPGDTVRYAIAQSWSSCGVTMKPNVGLQVANRTITANRECTDPTSGITYYFANNQAYKSDDDTLVLMVRKNGNNIGNLNSAGFAVTSTTLTGWGGGTAQNITFPAGTAGVGTAGNNYGARRHWKITHTGPAVLPSSVDVWVPLMGTDTTDVNGSAPGPTAPFKSFRLYSVEKPTISPDPAGTFTGATGADITVHTFSTTPSATNWVPYTSGSSTLIANFKTTTLHGGGFFYVNGAVAVSDINGMGSSNGINVYPNPTSNEWFFQLAEDMGEHVSLQLYTADGRLVHTQTLTAGAVNTVNASQLATGMYFYRVISGSNVSTGNILRN